MGNTQSANVQIGNIISKQSLDTYSPTLGALASSLPPINDALTKKGAYDGSSSRLSAYDESGAEDTADDVTSAAKPNRSNSSSSTSATLLTITAPLPSSLLTAARDANSGIGIFVQFGGQGYKWWEELTQLVATYPIAVTTLKVLSDVINKEASSIQAQMLGIYTHGFDVLEWITNSPSRPHSDYLQSAAISYPMICATQLCHYIVCLHQLSLDPSSFNESISGASGHSQGIMAAVACAASSTMVDFVERAIDAIRATFWIGARSQQVSRSLPSLPLKLLSDSNEKGYGTPSSMISVRGLEIKSLKQLVEQSNKELSSEELTLAIVSTRDTGVVSGNAAALHLFRTKLAAASATHQSQARVPFSKRKAVFTSRYLSVHAPFHTPLLAPAVPLILDDIKRLGIKLQGNQLRHAVYSTADGSNLQHSANLITDLIHMQCILPVRWDHVCDTLVTSKTISHILDFGPGGINGTARLTYEQIAGRGMQVIACGSTIGDEVIADRSALFASSLSKVPYGNDWTHYRPSLVQTTAVAAATPATTTETKRGGNAKSEIKANNTIRFSNKWTRVIGKPPIMVAGMTPTTVTAGIVAAATIAGYEVELAGGGLSTPEMFRARVAEVTAQIGHGNSISVNLLFLNPRLWRIQFPLCIAMRREGYPIDAITIAAGVPSLNNVGEIIAQLAEVGIKRIAFKPGSMAAILEVVEIAKAYPATHIVLQWTGGQAGGHHSCEDQYEPILATYDVIRRQSNIILVVGGGIGDGASSLPYFTGTWSEERGHAAMPFDGVLLGSRVMTCREAATDVQVKKLICNTPGCNSSIWERSFDVKSESGAGGVITVTSELGEPIHVISNKGTRWWRMMDETYFSQPSDKMLAAIERDRKLIIDGANENYQKPFFGQQRGDDGATVYHLRDLTYLDVADRMYELMCPVPLTAGVAREWINSSYQRRFMDWARRTVDRFADGIITPASFTANREVKLSQETKGDTAAVDTSVPSLPTDSSRVVEWLEVHIPSAAKTRLSPEDEAYFIALCKQSGKPVPFIPEIDADLKMWIKKDSLWYSEDMRTVPDNDADRVFILQGPISTAYSTIVNQPISDILNGMHNDLITSLTPIVDVHEDEEEILPASERFIPDWFQKMIQLPKSMSSTSLRTISNDGKPSVRHTIVLSKTAAELPSATEWLRVLALHADTSTQNIWRAMLCGNYVVRSNKKWVSNYIARLFAPRVGQTIELLAANGSVASIRIFDATITALGLISAVPVVEAVRNTGGITITVRHPRSDLSALETDGLVEAAELHLSFTYKRHGVALVEEPWSERCEKVTNFYRSLWCATGSGSSSIMEAISSNAIGYFRASINDFAFKTGHGNAPIDFGIVAGWEGVTTTLMDGAGPTYGYADLLSLVHLSNELIRHGAQPLLFNKPMEIKSELQGVWDEPEGRTISVRAIISNVNNDSKTAVATFASKPGSIEIISRFAIIAGGVETTAKQRANLFRTSTKQYRVTLSDAKSIAILLSKSWHTTIAADTLTIGTSLLFNLSTRDTISSSSSDLFNCDTTGTITFETNGQLVAKVSSKQTSVTQCGVIAYLNRHGVSLPVKSLAAEPRYYPSVPLLAPPTNVSYAIASKDINPIHTNSYAVALTTLPSTIVHGMYLSAQGRKIVEQVTDATIVSYRAEFKGMCQSSMKLVGKTQFKGLVNGKKLVTLDIRDAAPPQQLIVRATAQVRTPPTAYLFTGQGSAVVGMGQDLYASSPAAKLVWDTAESFFVTKYGFSLLNIVKTNPTTITISLLGEKGAVIRSSYQQLKVVKEGKVTNLFPESYDDSNDTITFTSDKQGLLFQTQFQQPAILLMEKATFEALEAKSGIDHDTSVFAGHSLGEYGAVGCLLPTISVAKLAEVVFLRGLTMQSAVPRDDRGRSRYGMIAVAPARLGTWFTESILVKLVTAIDIHSKRLLQVVNYNSVGTQYVVAGDLIALEALRLTIDQFCTLKSVENLASESKLIVKNAILEAEKKAIDAKDNGFLPLTRGNASIPLTGIDVPFHSRLLIGGVASFRKILQQLFVSSSFVVNPDHLINKYIPNLVGIPFELTKEFATRVHTASDSEVVADIITEWDHHMRNDASRSDLCKSLLVELLAYQFASPVQWISSQDGMIESGIRRFIEVGPSPVLTTMLKKSAVAIGQDKLELFWCGRDMDTITYANEGDKDEPVDIIDEAPKPAASVTAGAPVAAKPVIATVAPVAAPVVAVAVASSGGAGASSVPPSALHSISVIVAEKLGIPMDAVVPTKSLRELAGGKSALQNEIIGDVSAEFKCEPEGADDKPLRDLGTIIGTSRPNYTGMGTVLTAAVSRMLQRTMPGGFGIAKAREYIQGSFGVDQTTADGCLVHAITVKSDRLADPSAACNWLDGVVSSYASNRGVNISKRAAGGAGAGSGAAGGAVGVVDAKEVEAIKYMLKQQAQALRDFFGQSVGETQAIDRVAREEWMDILESEHGVKYAEGIKAAFDSHKIRVYDSSWAWGRQRVAQIITELSQPGVVPITKVEQYVYEVSNRADTAIVAMLAFGVQQINNSKSHVTPVITDKTSMSGVAALQRILEASNDRASKTARYLEHRRPSLPQVKIDSRTGAISFSFINRYDDGFNGFVKDMTRDDNPNRLTLTTALTPVGNEVKLATPTDTIESELKTSLVSSLKTLVTDGFSFVGQTALVTGAGAGSIGAEVVRCLLLGGCHVIITTSSATRARWQMYREMYERYGGKQGKLTVVPFNAASQRDIDSLIDALFDPKIIGCGAPHYIFPFAAINENGRDITRIDQHSEVAHRAMLTNVVRLIGGLASRYDKNPSGHSRHASCVILPLSPNHGTFGGDGLYSESKLALEILFAKWRSEGWSRAITLIGAEIGWTRGTGLMNGNDMVAEGIEKEAGLRTFDVTEMAFCLVALLGAPIIHLAKRIPLKADLSGGFRSLSKELPTKRVRQQILEKADLAKAVANDKALDDKDNASASSTGPRAEKTSKKAVARFDLNWPALPSSQSSIDNRDLLEGVVDLSKVVVVVGYGEVGPWGSARTRWQWECHQQFTAIGAIELARSMGLIKFHSGKVGDTDYIGWVDIKTNEPIADHDVATKYGDYIRQHCGIRTIEPAVVQGYDPLAKIVMSQVAIEADMAPFEVASAAEAEFLTAKHGKAIEIAKEESRLVARLKKGAVIYVPKSVPFDRTVAGQIPTGWNPLTYGIPSDLKVDPVTQYALAATIDAFASAGITDPYELYSHVHVSEVGNSCGGGMGGMASLRQIFRDRFTEKNGISSDVLQETFINTTAAWINMLILSSAGPIKTPVAACATAATSVDIGLETIKSGKAKVMITGGYEDFGEEGSYEFAQMKATSSSVKESSMGREPNEMCRPSASTRGGFMEAHGAGIQILMTAELALAMGLPIYSIVAGAYTATDRQGRSVPAPGKGILTTARESPNGGGSSNPLLSLAYRRRQLQRQLRTLKTNLDEDLLEAEAANDGIDNDEYERQRDALITQYDRCVRQAQVTWSNDFYIGDTNISPLRGTLAVWGLSIDDLDVASFHGTGTMANDKNESDVVNRQMNHLGRSVGNPLPSIWQKWATGHPKGAAAAWMMHGVIQSVLTGIVPGNINADNVCHTLQPFTQVLYLNKTLNRGRPLRAGYLHSFGFGQAGGEVIIVHPDYIYAVTNTERYESYTRLRHQREITASYHFAKAMCGERALIKIHNQAPYTDADMHTTFLDPLSRRTAEVAGGSTLRKVASAPAAIFTKEQEIIKKGSLAGSLGGSSSTGLTHSPSVTFAPASPMLRSEPSSGSLNKFQKAIKESKRSSSAVTLKSMTGGVLPPSSAASSSTSGSGKNGKKKKSSASSNAAAPLSSSSASATSSSSSSSTSGSAENEMIRSLLTSTHDSTGHHYGVGMGVDIESVADFVNKDELFLRRNFTDQEINYCKKSSDPAASLAARWCAKEAVIKAITSAVSDDSKKRVWKGSPSAPLINIEVVMTPSGAPTIVTTGQVNDVRTRLRIDDIVISMSHTSTHAVAQAFARRR